MNKLAIKGGTPVRKELFPEYNTIGNEELEAASKVLKSGVLSRYLGAWHDDFMGGEQVRSLESEAALFYGAKHALAVNSNTSGLFAAVGALPIEPGDEIICSPYTMAASATCAFVFNAIPVFADIDAVNFCISADTISKVISKRTKAIVVPHIFGNPAEMDEIMALAKKHNLFVIEDCAQIPFGQYKGRNVGTLADIAVFSLNYHKHIHTGEGGIILTSNKTFYDRMRLIRNHAEVVIGNDQARETLEIGNISNLLGFNFRMCEIEASIAKEQLKKVKRLIDERLDNCNYLANGLKGVKGLSIPNLPDHSRPNYYVFPILYKKEELGGLSRNAYVHAVKAELQPTKLREKEGVLIGEGYVRPLYLLPAYQQKIMFGTAGVPWTFNEREISYSKGTCPVCEDMHYNRLITTELMRPGMNRKDLDDVIAAFKKVSDNHQELL